MQNFNLHTHTTRCHHAVGSDEDYVIAAIKNGIKYLGFSDHVPFENTVNCDHHDRMLFSDMNNYIHSIHSLKEKYKDQITIFVGFECEYYPQLDSYYKELLNKVDYLLLGQHYPTPSGIDYCIRATDDEISTYATLVCQGIKTGYFTYVAHPEYFTLPRDTWSQQCTQAIEQICKTAEEFHIPLEINLKGISYGIHNFDDTPSYFYPNSNALSIFKKYNNDFVYGLDCHDPTKFNEMKNYILEFNQAYPNHNLHFIETLHHLSRIG